ncbi:MAG: gliding motility protein GldN [Paludibacteraceae bacterium]|jgi:gliding motility associated protien GldN|nr:gliding motility protein GldN [Paludibacteraceae bacterium]
MKAFYRILTFGLFLTMPIMLNAQEAEKSFFDESGDVAISNLPTSIPLDDREPIEYNNPRADDILWQKVVYRIIDLREKMNYPLYFPEEASDSRQSLFTTIFRLFEQGKIRAYAYQDNKEVFTEENRIKFDDFVKSCDILLTVKTDSITGDTLSAEIDESNIPNREVLKYYAKEVWYFDKHNSVFTVRLIALCPLWYREDYELGLQKRPLFWATYDDLRPYLAKQEALISDKNNGARETVDDLFIKRRFGSYIFKESSIMNRNILQYNNTAEEMHKEQNRIKTEIINFEQDLWEY